ncbi:MAG: alpha/beta hydrolase [Bacteroidota bacterium]
MERIKKGILLLMLLAVVACNEEGNEPRPGPIAEPDPLIEITFSPSPIDLEGIDAQFAQDLAYDQYEKTKFDVFLPNSASPTGMVIFIHGGGFTGGDKAFIYTEDYDETVRELLRNNLAVATLNYRLLGNNETEGVLKSLHDSRRSLQYIRYIFQELNIDKEKIVLFGSSAGAGTSLWLASHDDFKDEANTDPILRESTRVKGIALRGTQSSYDIEGRWFNDVFGEFGLSFEDYLVDFGEASILQFYGLSSMDEYDTPEVEAYRQEVDMLAALTADDPEIWVANSGPKNEAPQDQGDLNHHGFHAREIKEFADAAGVANVAKYGKPTLFDNQNGESYTDFLIRKVNE